MVKSSPTNLKKKKRKKKILFVSFDFLFLFLLFCFVCLLFAKEGGRGGGVRGVGRE